MGVFGVSYTFSVKREEVGAHKRTAGEAIRNLIYGYIHQYIKTTHKLMLFTDYRFSSLRQQGGSRKGLVGKEIMPGHLNERFVTGIQLEMRRSLLRAGPGINFG